MFFGDFLKRYFYGIFYIGKIYFLNVNEDMVNIIGILVYFYMNFRICFGVVFNFYNNVFDYYYLI